MEIVQSGEHKKKTLKKNKKERRESDRKYLKNKNLDINFSPQIQEAQPTPSTINAHR